MSSIAMSYKTDTGSKVLPGDKHGLPWEIWRIILSYLSAEDLCRYVSLKVPNPNHMTKFTSAKFKTMFHASYSRTSMA